MTSFLLDSLEHVLNGIYDKTLKAELQVVINAIKAGETPGNVSDELFLELAEKGSGRDYFNVADFGLIDNKNTQVYFAKSSKCASVHILIETGISLNQRQIEALVDRYLEVMTELDLMVQKASGRGRNTSPRGPNLEIKVEIGIKMSGGTKKYQEWIESMQPSPIGGTPEFQGRKMARMNFLDTFAMISAELPLRQIERIFPTLDEFEKIKFIEVWREKTEVHSRDTVRFFRRELSAIMHDTTKPISPYARVDARKLDKKLAELTGLLMPNFNMTLPKVPIDKLKGKKQKH